MDATRSDSRSTMPSVRGVHFGETPSERGYPVHRGVRFGEGLEADALPVAPRNVGSLQEQLAAELDRVSPPASAQQTAALQQVLGELKQVCQDCAAGAGGDQEAGVGELLPLGAFHLGVRLPEDEVDVLFVAPSTVQLKDFVRAISAELQRRGSAKNFATPGSDGNLGAHGLCFENSGVRVKVLLSKSIPELPPVPPPRDEVVIRDLAGFYAREASEAIVKSVPNLGVFRDLLRFVRYWAKQRGVIGSFLGFPGGMAWAVCCARVCKAYPNVELAQLAPRFFRTLSRWDWRQPMDLQTASTPLEPGAAGEVPGPCTLTILLPVGGGITATSTVTQTTTKIILKELRRGYKMVQQVEMGRAHWTDACKEARFFQRHRHYLEFDFMATSEVVFTSWIAWASQKLKDLGGLFEAMASEIVTLRPWPQWVEFKDGEWPYAQAVFIGLHLERTSSDGQQEGARKSFDLREPIVKILEAVSLWPDAETYANKFELLVKHVRLAELEQWLENRNNGVATNSGASGSLISGGVGQGAAGPPMGNWSSPEADGPRAQGLQQCSL